MSLRLINFQSKANAALAEASEGSEHLSMDRISNLLADLVGMNGLEDAEIHGSASQSFVLPGFYRPTQNWEFGVIRKNHLIAAIRLDHVTRPFDDNEQLRAAEVLYAAKDLWAAYRCGTLGLETFRPFVGWLMLVEDAEGSRRPIGDRSDHFPVRPEFQGASYIERYNLLCRKLVQENLYTSAAVLASPRTARKTGKFSDASELTSLKMFVTNFAAHIAAEAAR